MFAHLAGITERIGLATGILILPQRQTALVARQAADVDLLSGGRLRLGVGVGWNHVEYEALGQDFRTRGARQEEQIELLRRLFTEPVVDFSGRFDRVDRAALVPKPARSIPIWLGGFGEAAFARAARLADGFIFFGGGVAHAVDAWNRLREVVGLAGRSKTSAGPAALPQGGVGDLTERSMPGAVVELSFGGAMGIAYTVEATSTTSRRAQLVGATAASSSLTDAAATRYSFG
jgi:probable F420-dependent oxidoreductase